MIFVFRSVPFRLVGEDVSERVSEWDDDGRAGEEGSVVCVSAILMTCKALLVKSGLYHVAMQVEESLLVRPYVRSS
jgi:hypothetical protein